MASAGGERRGLGDIASATPAPTGTEGAPVPLTASPVGRRVRKSPSARRAELVATARQVLTAGGLNDGGMADVAAAAEVSKGLLYHYFPAGRPELLDAVGREVAGELIDRVVQAAAAPFSPAVRIEHVLAAVFAYFDEQPIAYRVLFVESSAVEHKGPGWYASARLSGELMALLTASGAAADELLALSAGLVGFVLANVELCLAHAIDAEDAWRASCRCARALLGPSA